ncbi:MAG TPA: hypothetical protein VHH72_06960 [Solirubrobacterales bacterium]|jgi:hypothetical protein|nr:hypothetical protein [Solirubrobacterales bacterium]
MAVLITFEFQATADQYRAINEKMDVAANPPAGLIVHVAEDRGSTMKVHDVWESEEAYETFAQERLGPAVAEVVGEGGDEETQRDVREVHNVIRG